MVQCVVQASLLRSLLFRDRSFEERSLDLDPLGWLVTADLLQREWDILSQEQCVSWSPLLSHFAENTLTLLKDNMSNERMCLCTVNLQPRSQECSLDCKLFLQMLLLLPFHLESALFLFKLLSTLVAMVHCNILDSSEGKGLASMFVPVTSSIWTCLDSFSLTIGLSNGVLQLTVCAPSTWTTFVSS